MTLDVLNAALLSIIALLLLALVIQGRERKAPKMAPVKLTSPKDPTTYYHPKDQQAADTRAAQAAPKDVREQLATAQARVHQLEPLAAEAAQKNADNIALLAGIAKTLETSPDPDKVSAGHLSGYAAAQAALRANIQAALNPTT